MKFKGTIFTSFLTVLCLLFALPAHAQETDEAPVAPMVQSQGSVSYISGGITVDERDVMKALAKDYNLHLGFALNVGSYVADVKVSVLNSKGQTVLNLVSEGPWLYAKLPAGKYKVTAEYEGKAISKSAAISAKKGANLYFIWPGVKEKYDD